MALKVDYVLRETATNLTRNVTLTLASVVTIGVSLMLFGSAQLLNQALGNATQKWKGGIEFIVYLQPGATEEQIESVGSALRDSPDVEEAKYVDPEATFEEFKRLFESSQPSFYKTVAETPEILPTSYRVVPKTKDTDVVTALGDQFEGQAGVREVVFAQKTIDAMERVFGKVRSRLILASLTLLGAALLLILNTIRVAMFARRREIEVMKLVGATNWFIRVPFIVEGVAQAVLGAILALGGLTLARGLIQGLSDPDFPLFSDFVIQQSQLITTGLVVVLLGILVGAVSSFFAASRFLDV